MADLVTLGETMAVVRGDDTGRLRTGGAARFSVAGAEATVAIGVCRLGHSATWIGRVGDDALGDMVVAALRGEGVDVGRVTTDPVQPTGLLVRHRRTADHTVVTYYREGLAGARLAPAMVPDECIRAARILHVSGITPALGAGPAAAVDEAVRLARAAGVTVAFDVNYRARLWTPERATPVLAGLAAAADIVFAGEDEAALILGERHAPGAAGLDPFALASAVRALGPSDVVIKRGRDGAVAVTDAGASSAPAVRVREVDPVGAGDAFVAGYLSGRLDGEPTSVSLARAAACGAFSVSTAGDWEGLPSRAELALLAADDVVR